MRKKELLLLLGTTLLFTWPVIFVFNEKGLDNLFEVLITFILKIFFLNTKNQKIFLCEEFNICIEEAFKMKQSN